MNEIIEDVGEEDYTANPLLEKERMMDEQNRLNQENDDEEEYLQPKEIIDKK